MKATYIKAFEKAELANMRQSDLDKYENSLKIYRDLKGVIDTAFDDGRLEGKLEGKLEVATSLKLRRMSIDEIAQITGLSIEQINKL